MSHEPETNQPLNLPFSSLSPESLRVLSAADAAALEALLAERGLAEGGGPSGPGISAEAARVAKLRAVLGLLEGDRADEQTENMADLKARTLAKIAALPEGSGVVTGITMLGAEDAEALDAVLTARAAGAGAGLGLAGGGERTAKVTALLGLLDRDQPTATTAPDADLAQRTADAVHQARQRERFAQQIDMLSQGPRSAGVSMRQVAAAAAVFLLGVSLLLPMLERTRASSQQAACASNLGLAGMAFNSYAADHGGVLPRGKSQPGSPWWNVGLPNAVLPDGTVLSNSAHLYTLVRSGYITPDKLACRTNAYAPSNGQMTVQNLDWSTPMAVSYSYQNQFTPEALRIEDARPTLAVLADKNPLFVPRNGRIIFDETVAPDAPSRLHGNRGQNVLAIDGHASWTTTPTFGDAGEVEGGRHPSPDAEDASGVSGGGDNFWRVAGKRDDYRYRGDELPAGVARDAFLVP